MIYNYNHLREFETDVMCIIMDTVESHKRFAEECGVPYRLLSDVDKNIYKEYGAKYTPLHNEPCASLIDKA